MTPALKIENLQKTYGNGFQALKGIDLTVEQGDFFALLGPNGAGKSTTIGIITSLVRKTAGNVSVMGADIDNQILHAKRNIGVVPQEFNLNTFENVKNILVTQALYFGIGINTAKARAQTLLKQLELWEKRDVAVRRLSGGMKRRLMIARALMHQPNVLILDEPTAGVDIEIRQSMWRYLREINKQGVTIILTTHYLEEAESLCNKIAIINHGELVVNTNMQSLLRQLESETVVIETMKPMQSDVEVEGLSVCRVDEHTLEVEMSRDQSLSAVLAMLSEYQIDAHRVRNKANRLEQLFIRLVESKGEAA